MMTKYIAVMWMFINHITTISMFLSKTLIVLSLADISMSPILEDLSLKLIFLNAVINPLFYGLCRKNYRKGYDFVTQSFCHYLSLGCIEKPGGKLLTKHSTVILCLYFSRLMTSVIT